jgi:hypothetical protein
MPITATPIDLTHIHVPDDLSEILRKGGGSTPIFDHLLTRNRKVVAALRRQVWPEAIAATPDLEPEAPEDPEGVPSPHPRVEPAETPAPEPADPEQDAED